MYPTRPWLYEKPHKIWSKKCMIPDKIPDFLCTRIRLFVIPARPESDFLLSDLFDPGLFTTRSTTKKTEKNCSWKRDKKSFVTICCWLKTQFLSFTSSGNSCCRNLLVAKIRQTEVSLNTYQSFHKNKKKIVLNFAKKCLRERGGSSHDFTIEFLWHEHLFE